MYAHHLLCLLCIFAVGCHADFTGYSAATSTTTPSKEQVQHCRDVMYIHPDITIRPLGYCLKPGIDDTILFKFVAETNDPAQVFDLAQVDTNQLNSDFDTQALLSNEAESWWDVADQPLSGGTFSVPARNTAGTRGLTVGYVQNGNGALTMYVLWFET